MMMMTRVRNLGR